MILYVPDDNAGGGGAAVATPPAPSAPSTPAAPSTPSVPSSPKPLVRAGTDAPTPPASQLTKVFKPDTSLVEDDSLTVTGNKTNINQEPSAPKIVVSPVVAAPTEPAKVVTTPVAPITTTPVTPPAIQPLVKLPGIGVPPVASRDYSGYDESTTAALKSMSNEAFEHTTKLIKQNRELSQASFLQHPFGYMLSPDYQKIVQDNHYLRMEGQIHQSNLLKAAEGQEFAPLRGFDKQGNPVYEPLRKPTTQDVELLRQQVGAALQSIGNTEQQMNQFAGQYKQVIINADNAIQQQRAQLFSWAEKPELMNHQIEVDGKTVALKEVHEYIPKLLPPWYRGLATTPIIGDVWVAYKLEQTENAKLRQEITLLKTKAGEVPLKEPTSELANPNLGGEGDKGKFGGPKTFSLKGLND